MPLYSKVFMYKHAHANSTNHASLEVADINEVLISAAVSFTTGLLCLRPASYDTVITGAMHSTWYLPLPRPLVGQLQVVPARYSESVCEVLNEIGEVLAVESVVRHLELGYMGRVDCIGRYKWDSCTSQQSTSQHSMSHHSTSQNIIVYMNSQ